MHRLAHWLFLPFMDEDQIEPAVRRIEAALARIAAVADAVPQSSVSPAAPSPQDEALRETVATTLTELDALIARLEA